MSIYIVEGAPGSGKSYFLVRWIAENYFSWNKDYMEYQPNRESSVHVYTNLAGLKLPFVHDLKSAIASSPERKYSIDGVEFVCRAGSREAFFCKINSDINNSILIVDEAQSEEFFPLKYKEASVIDFFSWHRHQGLEIFLLVQDIALLSPPIRKLEENCWAAAKRSVQLGGFRYNKVIDGTVVARKFFRYDKRIFNLYNSVQVDAKHNRVGSVLYKYIALILVGCVFFVFGWNYFMGMFKPRDKTVKKSNVQAVAPARQKEPLPVYMPVIEKKEVERHEVKRTVFSEDRVNAVGAGRRKDREPKLEARRKSGVIQLFDSEGNLIREIQSFEKERSTETPILKGDSGKNDV